MRFLTRKDISSLENVWKRWRSIYKQSQVNIIPKICSFIVSELLINELNIYRIRNAMESTENIINIFGRLIEDKLDERWEMLNCPYFKETLCFGNLLSVSGCCQKFTYCTQKYYLLFFLDVISLWLHILNKSYNWSIALDTIPKCILMKLWRDATADFHNHQIKILRLNFDNKSSILKRKKLHNYLYMNLLNENFMKMMDRVTNKDPRG